MSHLFPCLRVLNYRTIPIVWLKKRIADVSPVEKVLIVHEWVVGTQVQNLLVGPGLPNTACRLHLNICNVPKCNVLFSVLLYDDFIPGLGIRSSIFRSFDLGKRSKGSIRIFSRSNRPFFTKKRSIRSKNRLSNSQTCFILFFFCLALFVVFF